MKRTNSSWRKQMLFAAISFLVFMLATQLQVIAQTEIQSGALYNCPGSNMYNFKVLDCPDEKYCKVLFVNTYTPSASFESEVLKSKILSAFKAGGCTVDGKKLEAVNNRPREEENPKTKEESNKTGNNKQTQQTRTNETQPATTGCRFDGPAGRVSRNAKASPQLIQRVIYERNLAQEQGRKVGMSFSNFSLATSYVNRGRLFHATAPPGATVYRYKTDFVQCVKYTDSILRYDHQEAYFLCFKDRAGDWACSDDGVRNKKQSYLPVK